MESAYEVEGPLFVAAMLPFFHGATKWKNGRFVFFIHPICVSHAVYILYKIYICSFFYRSGLVVAAF